MKGYRIDDLPDDSLPAICELPGDLNPLAEVLERIVPGKGVRITLLLAEEYRGTAVYFHNDDWLKRKLRDQRIVERYNEGERVADIARDVKLSASHVWKILGREPGEDKQLPLF